MAGCSPGLPSSQPRLNSQPAGHSVSVVGRQTLPRRKGIALAKKLDGEEKRRASLQQEEIVQLEILNYS